MSGYEQLLSQTPEEEKPGPEVTKLFACSSQLNTKFILLINVKMLTFVGILTFISMINILGQKRNAAYKTYIVYGGLSPISRKRFVSLGADSWIMSSWGCPSYHRHRTKLIQQFKPTFLSILTSHH